MKGRSDPRSCLRWYMVSSTASNDVTSSTEYTKTNASKNPPPIFSCKFDDKKPQLTNYPLDKKKQRCGQGNLKKKLTSAWTSKNSKEDSSPSNSTDTLIESPFSSKGHHEKNYTYVSYLSKYVYNQMSFKTNSLLSNNKCFCQSFDFHNLITLGMQLRPTCS